MLYLLVIKVNNHMSVSHCMRRARECNGCFECSQLIRKRRSWAGGFGGPVLLVAGLRWGGISISCVIVHLMDINTYW